MQSQSFLFFYTYIKINNFANNIIMNTIKNILLYLSAFVPMYFLIIIKFVCGLLSGTININSLTIFTLATYSSLIVSGILGLLWSTLWSKGTSKTIIITQKQNLTDQHFLGYFSIFVLFALAFELTKLSMVVASLFIIIFIGIVYINNQMFYINPLLNLIGFSFFDIKYKLKDSETEYSGKIFSREVITLNKTYKIKSMENLSFLDKQL